MKDESPLNWKVICSKCGADIYGEDKVRGTPCSKHQLIKLAEEPSSKAQSPSAPPHPPKEVVKTD